jgi:hypothetical protein
MQALQLYPCTVGVFCAAHWFGLYGVVFALDV